MDLILGNSSGDMDSIASPLAFAKAFGTAFIPIININRQEMSLRKDVLYVCQKLSIDSNKLHFAEELPLFFEQMKKQKGGLILIDHNVLSPKQMQWNSWVRKIIDHHEDEQILYPHLESKIIAPVGSSATLISELIPTEKFTQDIIYLLLLPILLDTMNLTDQGKTTFRDISAVKRLRQHLRTPFTEEEFRFILQLKNDVQNFCAQDLLKKDYKIYQSKNLIYGIASLPKAVKWKDHKAASNNLAENKLAFLLILEWIGEEKGVWLYSSLPEIEEILLKTNLFKNKKGLFLKLKEPLPRKVLQPLIAKQLLTSL